MKKDPTRDELRAMAEAARDPAGPGAADALRGGLSSRSNLVIARAAQAIREARLDALADDVAAAFPAMMKDPARRDPTCVAKTEIVKCLAELEHAAADIYLAGARHVQLEKAWGPPVDTAAELRGMSAVGLMVTRHPEAPFEAVRLLADREAPARAGGARALRACRLPGAELALRLHVLRGEAEPGVLQEALDALLDMDPAASLPFVSGLLGHEDEMTAECAALTLGDSRQERALAVLLEALASERRPSVRRAVILALAALRQPAAFDVLVELIDTGSRDEYAAAMDALKLLPGESALHERAAAARERRTRR